jgi:chemotaxis protein CheD
MVNDRLLGKSPDRRGPHSGPELHCEPSLSHLPPSPPADNPRIDPVLARVVPGRLDRLRAQPRVDGQANFFYREVVFNADAVRIMPGEFYVHGEDIVITTTLGSCIAACLWDRQAQIGGMNHFMLPGGSGTAPDAGRYGIEAMERLVNALVKHGATRKTLDAKVFGGAAMIQGPGSLHVGERNTRFVLDYLREHGITLISKDVLGSSPRKVCFFPQTGRVMVRRLPPTQHGLVLAQEREARRKAGGGATTTFAELP